MALVLLFAGKAIADSVPQPPPADIPAAWVKAGFQSLPANIVAAWKKAGAAYGWISMQTQPSGNGISPTIPPPGAIPLFGFNSQYPWKPETISELPQPDQSFGLMLSNVKLTDSGLSCLRRFTHLRALILDNFSFTNADLKELAGFTHLQSLAFYNNIPITDADLKELASLTQLYDLELCSNLVTDAGLKQVAGFRQLRELSLMNARVTDAGLMELAGLKHLQSLSLLGTGVTYAGVAELKKSLPNLQVTGVLPYSMIMKKLIIPAASPHLLQRALYHGLIGILIFSIIFGLLCLFEVWAFPKYRNFFFNHSNNINTKTFVFETYLRTAGFVFIALATVIIVLTLLHLILFVTSGHN